MRSAPTCSAANNVVLKDTLPENATLVEGTLEADIGKITVGSHVKHTYTVVFTYGGTFTTLPLAVASYVAEPESTTTQACVQFAPCTFLACRGLLPSRRSCGRGRVFVTMVDPRRSETMRAACGSC